MSGDVVRLPRQYVFRLVERFGLNRNDGLDEIDAELRQVDQALKRLPSARLRCWSHSARRCETKP